MKKLMVVVAAMGFAVGVYAQDAAKPAAKADDAAVKAAAAAKAADIKKADANNDGKVSVEEYAAFYKVDAATAKKADKNNTGFVEVEEFVVVAPAAKAPEAKK